MSDFDVNSNGEEGFCVECVADDRREDHASDCGCYCHYPARINQVQAELKAAREELKNARIEEASAWALAGEKSQRELREKLDRALAERDRFREALEKIRKSTEVGDRSAWIAKAALQEEKRK